MLLLEAILAALLRGEDVSDLIGIRRSHARRPSDPIRIAIHYLCLTKLMHVKAEEAWRIGWRRLGAEETRGAMDHRRQRGDGPGIAAEICRYPRTRCSATVSGTLAVFGLTVAGGYRKGLVPEASEPPSHR